MAAKKPNRQQMRRKQAARAARAAEEARRRRARRRRRNVGVIVAIVAAAAVLAAFLLVGGEDGTTDVATTPSTPPTSAALVSAAGKPCVEAADAPAGAPAVPVKVGPPPAALITEDLRPGTGAEVTPGANVTINYVGVACSTGKVFDSSYGRGQPLASPLGRLIPGWQKGIPGMKVGGQRLLGIPPADGYGERGSGSGIAPGETLWFVVEVLDAKPAG